MKRLLLIAVSFIVLAMSAPEFASAKTAKTDIARIDFVHKYNASYNCSLSVKQLKNMSRLMPATLKKEIGMDYMPQILSGLRTADCVSVKDVNASISYCEDDMFEITLFLPKATIYIRNATWDELDRFFGSVI